MIGTDLRTLMLVGLAGGLASSPWVDPGKGLLVAITLAATVAIVGSPSRGWPVGPGVLVAAAVIGLLVGGERLDSIRSQAMTTGEGREIRFSGYLREAPEATVEGWKAVAEAPGGRVLVTGRGPRPAGPGPGDGIIASGSLSTPPPWLRERLRAEGVALELSAGEVRFGGPRRSGIEGFVDSLRRRAEQALGFGMPETEAALARGFVLGQDQAIPGSVIDAFRDSGLSHLLAVSGQNVLLLLLLAWPILSLAGVPLRARYLMLAGLVLLYVPLAGGGPSIQRAGVMGLAGLAAASAGRPLQRSYPLLLAAAVTLLLDPSSTTDVGWQLSFAAVIGILLLSRPIGDALRNAGSGRGGPVRAALVEGSAVTVAASVSTLPLVVWQFGWLPLSTVLANLVAMPAVAPAMWMGMLSAAVGQIGAWAAAPFNLLNSILLAYIRGVADLFGDPGSVIEVETALAALVVTFACLLFAALASNGRRAVVAALVALSVVVPVVGLTGAWEPRLPEVPEGGVAVDVLDVGQGDAILVRSELSDPLLVDTGPPGGGVVSAVEAAGVSRLGGVVVTHLDRDHAGGYFETIGGLEVGSVLFDRLDRPMRASARFEGATRTRIGQGDSFTAGPARVEVVWPPRGPSVAGPVADRNALSVVLVVEFAGRRILLTGDAEAELVPLDPGPIDVLKVAHHGSEDLGLPELLAKTGPKVAVISAGSGNPYGHPVPSTLEALERASVRTFRTDRDGAVSILVEPGGGLGVETAR